MVSQASVTGSYVPPVVPQSRTLPVFEDFKLLRTVGKGAFGKVCSSCDTPPSVYGSINNIIVRTDSLLLLIVDSETETNTSLLNLCV